MQAGNIQVIEAESNFKKVHKSIINNPKIDCQTLGIYVRIITFGQTWQLNINGLSKHLSLSDTKIRASIKMLEEEGYITRHSIKGERGKFLGWSYKVFCEPVDERTKAGSRTCKKTDTPLNGQHRLRTTPFTDNTENGEENNIRPNQLLDLNKEETKEKKDTYVSKEFVPYEWKSDYNEYVKMVNEAKRDLLNDPKFRSYFDKYHPNHDIQMTLEKSVDTYWGTLEAWEKQKKKKGNIRLKEALRKNCDKSLVYKSRSNTQGVKRESKSESSDGVQMLKDGTYVSNGFRYYVSKKYQGTTSIHMDAPMRPTEEYEYDIVGKKWVL